MSKPKAPKPADFCAEYAAAAVAIKQFKLFSAPMSEADYIYQMMKLEAALDSAEFTAEELPAWEAAQATWRAKMLAYISAPATEATGLAAQADESIAGITEGVEGLEPAFVVAINQIAAREQGYVPFKHPFVKFE